MSLRRESSLALERLAELRAEVDKARSDEELAARAKVYDEEGSSYLRSFRAPLSDAVEMFGEVSTPDQWHHFEPQDAWFARTVIAVKSMLDIMNGAQG